MPGFRLLQTNRNLFTIPGIGCEKLDQQTVDIIFARLQLCNDPISTHGQALRVIKTFSRVCMMYYLLKVKVMYSTIQSIICEILVR